MLLICARLLPDYLTPLRSGALTEGEGVKLWRAIQPKLAHTTTVLGCVTAKMGHVELPHTSRVLLVSAFLASHNPARLDKRLVVPWYTQSLSGCTLVPTHKACLVVVTLMKVNEIIFFGYTHCE